MIYLKFKSLFTITNPIKFTIKKLSIQKLYKIFTK